MIIRKHVPVDIVSSREKRRIRDQAIRAMYRSRERPSFADLSREFGLSRSRVWAIVRLKK